MSSMQATHSEALTPELHEAIRMAADWYVQLQNASHNDAINSQWHQWLETSPVHRQAWQQVQAVQDQCTQIPGSIAVPVLQDADISRRRLLQNLASIAVIAPTAWVAYRAMPWREWQADYRTALGERRQITLADGSQLILNTGSAVDVRYTTTQRLVYVHEGEILIQTAKDIDTQARPFRVGTRHGMVEALGTRFTVRLSEQYTRVAVLEEAVRVMPAQMIAGDAVLLHQGEQISFNSSTTADIQSVTILNDSWVGGSLVVVDIPLVTLLNELERYRPGSLSCDPAIAELKISGAFPLADTELALKVLTDAFPLRQSRLTRYWVRINPS